MRQTMTPLETEFRAQIDERVADIRSLLADYPADVAHCDRFRRDVARRLLNEAMVGIGEVEAAGRELEHVHELTTEGLLLCGATTTAVQLVRDLLATLTAELDATDITV